MLFEKCTFFGARERFQGRGEEIVQEYAVGICVVRWQCRLSSAGGAATWQGTSVVIDGHRYCLFKSIC